MTNLVCAIVYGDRREVFLAKKLLKLKSKLILIGFNKTLEGFFVEQGNAVVFLDDIKEAVKRADIIILPVAGVNNRGIINSEVNHGIRFDDSVASLIKPQIPILVGFASDYLNKLKKKHHLYLFETIILNDVAIYNSIPSAEGAIYKAMEMTETTIHGSNSIILGFGRLGITLARTLKSLGAKVYVAARNKDQLARAYEMGCVTVTIANLKLVLSKMELVFNTVPDLILTKELLELIKNDTVIIDLASSPGGVDYKEAKKLGIQAYLAPGLPGIVAPKTAGEILAVAYVDLIKRILACSRGGVIDGI